MLEDSSSLHGLVHQSLDPSRFLHAQGFFLRIASNLEPLGKDLVQLLQPPTSRSRMQHLWGTRCRTQRWVYPPEISKRSIPLLSQSDLFMSVQGGLFLSGQTILVTCPCKQASGKGPSSQCTNNLATISPLPTCPADKPEAF